MMEYPRRARLELLGHGSVLAPPEHRRWEDRERDQGFTPVFLKRALTFP
jgi:hypothetical protein